MPVKPKNSVIAERLESLLASTKRSAHNVKLGSNWTCPYCRHAQVVSAERIHDVDSELEVHGSRLTTPYLRVTAVVCANDQCRELTLSAGLSSIVVAKTPVGTHRHVRRPGKSWTLLPPSTAKPQPDCVPEPLRADYAEACAIRDLSPKASATIIRRCLQGMIRDFCGIKKGRLIDEIKELRALVEAGNAPRGVQHDSVDAIDHVRGIGNIGAHMEKDINTIIDVDPDEAQRLIELTEMLFEEWYEARHRREQRLQQIGAIAAEKAQAKAAPKAGEP
ncbi:DUF4145 domain-containing protein [Bradyrhizobium sp. 63_E2_N1_3]|uniref:DUF4145 domain-containing protein n=1 Tax=Bradyrhizobium sp. 63_E2_N1_3 TaxID=3240373 RepID=UPI003F8AD9F0